MEKEATIIDFIELCKLIKDNKQPKYIKINNSAYGDGVWEWSQTDYALDDNIFLSDSYNLWGLNDLKFEIIEVI